MSASLASERARRYLSDLVDRVAARDGRPRADVLADLGVTEATPWGPRQRVLTRALVSAAIDMARRDLARGD